MYIPSWGMIDQGANGYALLVPPFYSAWVGGLFWFEVLLIGSVDGMVKGFEASPQSGFF